MSFQQDVLHGSRALRKAPWFALSAIVVLALGIGVTTATFSLVDAALLRPLPFREAHQLVMLWEKSPQSPRMPVSLPDFGDWSDQNRTFAGMAASAGVVQIPLADEAGGVPEAVALQSVTTTYFDVLAITPILGRTLADEDVYLPGATSGGMVISEHLWRTRFGSDPGVIGRTIRIASPPRPVPIVGVVPANATLLGATDVWEGIRIVRDDQIRGQRVLRVVGRLKADTTLAQAQADLTGVAENIARAAPATNKGWGATVEPLQTAIVGNDLRATSLVLGGVVLFVLLLACANVANLILARGVGRTREVAVRAALGGTRWRIAMQFLAENAVLGVLGGVTGLAVAWSLLWIAPSLIPPQTIPVSIVLGIDWRLAAFAMLTTFMTALLCGLAPAWQAAHVPLFEAMNAGGRSSSDRVGNVRRALAVFEIAVALLLITGASLLVRTLVSLNNVDPGFKADNVVTMLIRLPFRRLFTDTPGDFARYWHRIEEEVALVPGVRGASIGSDAPLSGISVRQPFEIVGNPSPEAAYRPTAHYQTVGPQFFDTLGISLTQGRVFSERDTDMAPPVAVVNDAFVRTFLGGRDPIGARIRVQSLSLGPTMETREIVGVVSQVKTRPEEPSDSTYQVYVPLAQNAWIAVNLIVRTAGEPLRMVPQIKAAVARADPTQAVAIVRTMEQIAADATARPRFRAQLVTGFASLATALAAVGILSVLLFMVQQRAREFSVRLAIGASAMDLLQLVLGDGLKMTAIGVGLGLVASALLVRSLGALLFGVAPFDPVTFIAAPAALMLVALGACLVPAVRALRADPVAALRAE